MAYRGKKLTDLKGGARQKRIKQLLANPGTRKLVPTADLPSNLARKRLLNERLDTPVTPGSPLTERGLAREANAAVDVQYGDQKRLYERQAQATPGYYQAYLNQLRSQQQADAQRSANTAGAIGALYNSGPQAPNSQQSNVGAMQAGTVQALGAAQGNYSSALQAAAQAGGIQALQAVKAKQVELAGTMGSANQQYRSKRRSEEFTNVATAALTGQKQETADSEFSAQTGFTPAQWAQLSPSEKLNALKRASRAKAKPPAPPKPRSQESIDRPYLTKYGMTYAQFKAAVAQGKRPKPLSGGKGAKDGPNAKDPFGNTPKDRSRHSSQYKKALRIGKVIGGDDPAEILLGLTQKFPTVDDAILAGAAQTIALGHVGPKTAARLKRLGISGGFKTKKPDTRPSPKPGSGPAAAPQ